MLRKSLLKHACGTTYVQNHYFEGKCSGNHYFKMHLAPHMYKNIIWRQMLRKSLLKHAFGTKYVQNHYFKANAKEIITLKCIWHQIYTKLLLWMQMLRKSSLKNAFDVISIVKVHTIKWQIYPDEVFYAKDLFTYEGNYLVYSTLFPMK